MEIIYQVSLFIVGVINILPGILMFLPNKISKSYGIEIPDKNYELVLRHRASLLGLVGGLLIYSSITLKHHQLISFIGFFSMLSYVIFYFLLSKEINSQLKKVMQIDVVAILILGVGYFLYN